MSVASLRARAIKKIHHKTQNSGRAVDKSSRIHPGQGLDTKRVQTETGQSLAWTMHGETHSSLLYTIQH